jgi:hypothetical protein
VASVDQMLENVPANKTSGAGESDAHHATPDGFVRPMSMQTVEQPAEVSDSLRRTTFASLAACGCLSNSVELHSSAGR